MNSRERVLRAVRFEETDRVPLIYKDIPSVEARMLRDLNLKDTEELYRYFDIDFRFVEPEYIGPPLTLNNGNIKNIWGIEYQYIENDKGATWFSVSHPLADARDPDELDNYTFPSLDWFNFSSLNAQLDKYEGYAIMTAPGYASPGLFSTILELCGIEKALTDMYLNPEFFTALSKKIMDFMVPFIDKMFAAGEGRIDFFRTGDDFGTQRGLLMSPEMFREYVKPSLIAMGSVAKQYGAYHYHHCCGAIYDLIPDLIESGIAVLDPLQVKAEGMSPTRLKKDFGDKICFCGGVDVQELLNRGTSEDVKNAVNDLLDIMMPGGGFILGPTHNFQDDIPTENIVALYDTAGTNSIAACGK